MRKHAFILLLTAVASLLLAGCRHDDVSEAFSQDGTIRLESGGTTIFQYNPISCQQFFNRSTGTFRVGTDTMSDYFSVALSEIPSNAGAVIRGDIKWSTRNSTMNIRNVTLKLIRLEGDTLWLWSAKEQIGLVVRLID